MDFLSLVCGDLGGCAVWSLVGLPLSHCDAVQKRAHRLGAHTVGRYPSRRKGREPCNLPDFFKNHPFQSLTRVV